MTLAGGKQLSDSDRADTLSNDSIQIEEAHNEEHATVETEENPNGSKDSDAIVQSSFYDEIDQFDINDSDIGDIGVVSKNKIIQGAIDGFISIKMARTKLASGIKDRVKLDKVIKRFEKQRNRIDKTMATAPFVRSMDKFTYVLGSNYAIMFAYSIAKYPHDHFYTFCTITHLLLMVHRIYTFCVCGWQCYLVDFCYFANIVLFYYINFAP